MRQIVREWKTVPELRNYALALVSGVAPKDYAGELNAIHAYVRDQIRYVRDVNGVETIQTPDVTVSVGSGDCDDKSILVAALLESIGHPCRFVAIGFEPDVFEHVYVETRLGHGWITVETTEPVECGWQPENVQARMVEHI